LVEYLLANEVGKPPETQSNLVEMRLGDC